LSDAFGPDFISLQLRRSLALLQWTTHEVWGYRSQPMLACRFVNRVVTASDSVDTSRMERLVLCACVGPQRTLDAPGEGAIFGPKARRMKAVSFARPGNFAFLVSLF